MVRFEMRSCRYRKVLIGWCRWDEVMGDEVIVDEVGIFLFVFVGYVF